MELKELLAKLIASPIKDVVAALKEHAHAIYQEVFNAGHGKATAEATERETALNTKVTDAEKKAAAAEKKLSDYEKKAPEIATLREQHATEITELKTAHKTELDTEREGRKGDRIERAIADYRAALIAGGVDEDMATVKAQHPDIRKRFQARAGDGVVEILQDGKTIPIQADSPDKAVKLFAEETKKSIDPKFIRSGADGGSGTGTGGGAGGGGGGGNGKADFKAIREQTEAANKSSAGAKPKINERFPAPGAAR